MKTNNSEKFSLDLTDLNIESFDTTPEGEVGAYNTGCYDACDTGCDTVVCCYPTQGNGTDC